MAHAEPAWLTEARRHIGVAEIPGPAHNPTIQRWLQRLRAWWSDDETPWCGVFVAACLSACGQPLPQHWMRALTWATWGRRLSAPTVGCLAVFMRQGGGHVGFVVGQTAAGHLLVLGGNQGNRVSIAPFDRQRVLAYVWPGGEVPALATLPTLHATAPLSSNEA